MDKKEAYGQVINIGSNYEITILDLAKTVIKKTKSKSNIRVIPYEDIYGSNFEDLQRRVPSTKKLEKILGRGLKSSVSEIIDEILENQ